MMGIEYSQWEYNRTHNGNTIFTMGIQYLQWEYCITHDGNRIFTMVI